MTNAEAVRLALAAQAGDCDALTALTEAHLRLVEIIANERVRSAGHDLHLHLHYKDMRQTLALGFMEDVVPRYDKDTFRYRGGDMSRTTKRYPYEMNRNNKCKKWDAADRK